ncbi:MAG: hypothetical protein V4813_04605 [Gemmatimonadota bacterium]
MQQLSPAIRWIVFAIVLSACSTKEATPNPKQPTTRNLVSLSASEYAIVAPDTIAPGWTNLRLTNRGQEVHYGHIVRLDPGKTVQELIAAYAEAIRTSGPRPTWVTRFGGPGGAFPGDSSTVTQYLEPGSYVWICPIEDDKGIPHFSKGEFRPFVISAGTGVAADSAARPEATMVIRLMDFSFGLDSVVAAGRHTIRVENTGVEPHDLVVMKLAPGMTLEGLMAVMNPEKARRPGQAEAPPPPPDSLPTGAGGIAAIAPKMESFFETTWTPGDYVLLCMATAPDGRAHIEHGMVKQIRVN